MSDTVDARRAGGRLVVPGYAAEPPDTHPPLDFPGYRATRLRVPHQPLVPLPQRLAEVTGPLLGEGRVADGDHDLTVQYGGAPLGERIVVQGGSWMVTAAPSAAPWLRSGRRMRPGGTAMTVIGIWPRWTPTLVALGGL
jgi:Protocatechuate 3,4-dioxygenase beta subunit N terminal